MLQIIFHTVLCAAISHRYGVNFQGLENTTKWGYIFFGGSS